MSIEENKEPNESFQRILAIIEDMETNSEFRFRRLEGVFKNAMDSIEVSFSKILEKHSGGNQAQELAKSVHILEEERYKLVTELKGLYNNYKRDLSETIENTFEKIRPSKRSGTPLLIDKTIEAMYINEDKTIVKLKTDKGFISLMAEGDCCSESWFEHSDNLDKLVGATIEGCEEIALDDVIESTKQECDSLYSFRIIHKKKRYYHISTLEFRNSSNGYYGGYLVIERTSDNLDGFKELTTDL